MFKRNIYYPRQSLDTISAQNQPYPSPNYYPYPPPTNTYGLNPSTLTSLKTLDIDNLQDVFGKGFQDQHSFIVANKIENERIFNEDSDISDIKSSIQRAKLNKILSKQMYQNQMKRIQNIINDTRTDEEVLKNINKEQNKQNEEEIKDPDALTPLKKIDNLLIITKGGAQPILLDKYDEYLNLPQKIVKMSDLVNYLDIFDKYHSQFPSEKKVLNKYLL